MKCISALLILMLIVGCQESINQPKDHSQVVTTIDTPELIEAFITYVHKAEKPEVDRREEMLKELQEVKDDPLLAPYVIQGTEINRIHIIYQIEQAIAKWIALDIPLSKTATYASAKSNLENLSDAELVIAFRLVNQVVSQLGQ